MFKKWVSCLFLGGLLLGWGLPLKGEAAEPTLNFWKSEEVDSTFEKREHAFSFGGGGNVAISDSDFFDTIAGGSILARYTFQEFVSLQSNIDFNRFPAQGGGVGGDIDAVALLGNVLIHTPYWNNLSLYALGGVGYQFNSADDVDLNFSAVGLSGVTTDVKVDDGAIYTVGAGADIRLSEHFLFNFEVRYQFAEFDFEGDISLLGTSVTRVKTDGDFDTLILRASLLYRF